MMIYTRSEVRESELQSHISSAKEEVSMASNTLRAMIRAFKQSQLYMTPTRGPTDLGVVYIIFTMCLEAHVVSQT